MAKKKTPQDVAASQVDAALAPLLADLQERGQTATTNLGGIYGALAKAQEAIAPAVQETYQTATANTAAFGKGYSDALKAQLGDSAAQANIILAQNNSPQTVQGGEGAADVLFGFGGSIPGQALAREGAAFTAAAQMLPGQARTLGAQARAKSMFDVEEQIRKIEAERPGLIQKALSELQQAKLAQQELSLKTALAKQEFGLDVRKQAFDEAATKVKLDQASQRLTLEQQRLQQSGQRIKLSLAQERFNQALDRAKLELSQDEYDLAVQREKRMNKRPKKGGLTASQKQELAQQALETAHDDFYGGYKAEDGTWVSTGQRSAAETLKDLLAAGVPYSIAYKAILRYARSYKSRWAYALKWQRR